VVNIEGGEDGEAAGLGIGRKKYKIFVQRVIWAREKGRGGGRGGGREGGRE
jgi:hypothetical protein